MALSDTTLKGRLWRDRTFIAVENAPVLRALALISGIAGDRPLHFAFAHGHAEVAALAGCPARCSASAALSRDTASIQAPYAGVRASRLPDASIQLQGW